MKIISNNFFYSVLASFIFLFLIFFYISIKTNGFLNLNNNFIIQNFEKPQWNVTKKNNKKCFLRSRNFCKFDIGNNNKKIILLGDSHAASFQDTLKKNLNNTQLFLATGEPFT